MGENNKNAANSGVLYVGEVGKTFRNRYEWLKWYYGYKGYRFDDVRKHILSRYSRMLSDFSFRALFELFSYQMFLNHRAELCDVVNDNDHLRTCCPNDYIPSSEYPARHVYPLVKFSPMLPFSGRKAPSFGYFTILDLVRRLSKN